MRASFCSPCPARLGFFLFFPVFSLAAGHQSSFSSPMPRPPQISSLLPCFFSDGGASQASFCSLCPARLGFSLFFPAFSLPAGHHRLLFALHAPPASDFLSSSLFFLWRRGTTGFLLIPVPRPPRIFSLLPCFFSAGGAPQASFCSLCPARDNFSLFFPVFSLAAGHQSSFSSPVPRPPRIFSLLPCFFFDGGAPQASFCSPCPARDARPLGPQPHSHKNSDVKAFLRISASTSSTCLPDHSGRTPYQNQVLHRLPPEDTAWRSLPAPSHSIFFTTCMFSLADTVSRNPPTLSLADLAHS